MAQPDPMIDFAELDAHNCLVTSATSRCVVIFGVCRPLPVYPDEQTFSGSVGMSQRCHFRTHAVQQTGSLFDDLVGDGEQRRRHIESEHPSGLGVDD